MEKHGNEQMEQESKEVKTVLTLDEEKKYDMSFMEPSLKAQAGSLVDDGKTAAAGAVDESMLTDEERKQVAEFVKQIDVSDIKVVNSYGAGAQKGISTFSASITGTVKTKEFGEVGDSLRELKMAIDSTIVPEKKGIMGIFRKENKRFLILSQIMKRQRRT